MKTRMLELRCQLNDKEKGLSNIPEIAAVEAEIDALTAKLKWLNMKHEKELKLAYVLNRQYRMLPSSRVFAKEEHINAVNEVLALTPDTVLEWIKAKGFGMTDGWKTY